MEEITNQEKGRLYASYWGRLKNSIKHEFYLESIFIAYDYIEDCTRSILKVDSVSKELDEMFISKKLTKIENKISNKKNTLSRYITPEKIEETRKWLDDRNDLIHRMLKNNKAFQDSKSIAERGVTLARYYMNVSSKYARAMAKKEAKR